MPPAPNMPARAVIDITAIIATVYPRIKEGIVSGRSTLNIIWKLVLPMDLAASIFPFDISRRLLSTIRAYIGMQLAAMAMMQALVPYDFPKKNLDTGIIRIIMTIWGRERRQLISQPKPEYRAFTGTRPTGLVIASNIPMKSPTNRTITDDRKVI